MDIWHLWSAITSLPAGSNTHSPLTLDLTRPQTAQIHNFWSHIFKRRWQKQQQVNRCQTEKKSSTLPGAFQKLQFQTLTLKIMVLCTEEPQHQPLMKLYRRAYSLPAARWHCSTRLAIESSVLCKFTHQWEQLWCLCGRSWQNSALLSDLTALPLSSSPCNFSAPLNSTIKLVWLDSHPLPSNHFHTSLPPAGSHALFLQVCDVPTPAVSTRPLNSFSQKEADLFIFWTYLFLKGCLKKVPDFFRLRSSSSGFFCRCWILQFACLPQTSCLLVVAQLSTILCCVTGFTHAKLKKKLSLVDRYKETSKQI